MLKYGFTFCATHKTLQFLQSAAAVMKGINLRLFHFINQKISFCKKEESYINKK